MNQEDKEKIQKALAVFMNSDFKGKFIVFDLETNGLMGSEVLSISAQKCQIGRGGYIQTLDAYDRYYYPRKPFNPQATAVNGLSDNVITHKRVGMSYPKYFIDDVAAFTEWCGPIRHFVGHNHINFDTKFFPKDFTLFTYLFDTMRENTPICRLYSNTFYAKYKAPRLSEAAEFYNIELDKNSLHTSSYDVEMTTRVFEAMLKETKQTAADSIMRGLQEAVAHSKGDIGLKTTIVDN